MTKLKVINKELKNIIKLLCKSIRERRLIRFYYESDSSGKKEWRTIEPYIIAKNAKDNLILVGLPLEQIPNRIDKRITPHYLIEKFDINKLEILSKTYKEPKVSRDRIVDTPTIEIICRSIYEDENTEEVMATWIKLDEL
jgi:hypothetical protein